MRLKIRRQMSNGEYFISFETLGFSPDEVKKMKIFGAPQVDFGADGLGTHALNQMDLTMKCRSAQEAERITDNIKQNIKSKLTDLSVRKASLTREKVARIYSRGKMVALGLACILVFLMLSVYRGEISSKQMTVRDRLLSDLAQSHPTPDGTTNEESALFFDETDFSEKNMIVNSEGDLGEDFTARVYAKGSSGAASSAFVTAVKPDFTITAIPEILARYSTWGNNTEESESRGNYQNFKLILTPSGEFEGPVLLGFSNFSSGLTLRLYPEQIEKLPGSSTLLVSFPAGFLPQICPEITIVARGKTSAGDLITHEKRMVVAIRQRSSYQGPVWHVSKDGSDQSGDGGWGSPFRTIQRAIDCAQTGDTVLVGRGLYRENVKLDDKDCITVVSHFIYDRDESTVRSTIIQGQNLGWVVTIARSEEITLCGFTIQNGRGANGSCGGGICCYNSSLNVCDNIVTGNENHSGYGAGIYCYDSKPRILRNQITKNCNYDGHGAGIYCYRSNPDIQHNLISGNYSSGGGSAIHLLESGSVGIIRNVICADSGYAAVVLYDGSKTGSFRVLNNTISHNQGDAIRYFGGFWSFENNIITHNEGYGLFTLQGVAYLANNDIWGNVRGNDTLNYYGLAEDLIANDGNISEDPCFGNPPHGNFHLCFDSPCINSGNPSHPVPLNGGSCVDMGALEYTYPDLACGDLNRDGIIDYGDINYLVGFLSGNTPSPDPFHIGDVNCDDEIDQRDLGELYRFLYHYGPAPCSNIKSKDRFTKQ